ncbi:hypothetical protein ACQI5H_22870 [Mycobacterium heidelbergense]|uniref:hypothetical protein n=1 Tax=Mycobacterium heidelbergense TaxID=53376 RepID=UPI003CEF237E
MTIINPTTLSRQFDSSEHDTMRRRVGLLTDRGVDAAIAMHKDVMRIYEDAWNAHTFDFESDVGHFMAPDITIVSGGMLGGRSVLAETSEARADYVRNSKAIVTMDLELSCVAHLDTTVVVVAEGDFTFTYPDRTTYTQQILVSSTLRLLCGRWVFQHIHCGRDCF